jgi:hypothetical protein
LRTLLADGVARGASYGEMAGLISALFEGFSRDRAMLISTTEASNAYSEGNLVVARDLAAGGLPLQKRWVTAGDERVEELCRSNEADGWIPLEQPFSTGAMRVPQHPRCRCVNSYSMVPSDTAAIL